MAVDEILQKRKQSLGLNLLVQSQQRKHKKNERSLLKVTIKKLEHHH